MRLISLRDTFSKSFILSYCYSTVFFFLPRDLFDLYFALMDPIAIRYLKTNVINSSKSLIYCSHINLCRLMQNVKVRNLSVSYNKLLKYNVFVDL